MSHSFLLNTASRSRVLSELQKLTGAWEVVCRALPTRSTEQNAKLHALCSDIAKQRQWAGEWLETEDWKRLFVAALYGQKVMPSLNGDGFVVLNKRTSKMTVAECIELIEFITAWAVDHGVLLWDDAKEAA